MLTAIALKDEGQQIGEQARFSGTKMQKPMQDLQQRTEGKTSIYMLLLLLSLTFKHHMQSQQMHWGLRCNGTATTCRLCGLLALRRTVICKKKFSLPPASLAFN